ncbi:DUF805 domain-containing protein [Ponticaulis sp.]|uniref:DUF805 domain-containing protein n=1 Tax=Ponticaulis sp. TaxID=2020902 RepID=UPI0025FF994C|nr:DUF805 domain-containing protein [Ponticaulis sp.]
MFWDFRLNYFNFSVLTSKQAFVPQFAVYVLGFALFAAFSIFDRIVLGQNEAAGISDLGMFVSLIGLALSIVLICPLYALLFRRLHDVGESAIILLYCVIPIAGFYFLFRTFVLLFKQGDQARNDCGAPPET